MSGKNYPQNRAFVLIQEHKAQIDADRLTHEKWLMEREQSRAEKAKQPGIPELYQMLSEVLQQLAEVKRAVAI